mmetsp:Transcript_1475/g.2335  ORF Transcript_1475/g.2335 Transcript_1475/m.2335 type:complete len:432 (+) Transcript_1475:81-1376(+)
MGSDEFRARLTRFYKAYEPSKLGNIDGLVAKAGDDPARMEQLIDMLTDKYGPEPLVSDPEGLRRRITAFYNHYNPSKLNKVDDLVKRTKRKANYEHRLMGMLIDKYGEEPAEGAEGTGTGASVAPPAAPAGNDNNDDEEGEGDSTDEDDSDGDADEPFVSRLTRFYSRYAPEKLGDIERLVEKTQGKWQNEEKLMEMLVQKYGPEFSLGDEKKEKAKAKAALAGGSAKTQVSAAEGNLGGAGCLPNPDSKLLNVVYCPVDGMPPEYCEFTPAFLDTVPWLAANCPNLILSTKKKVTVAEFAEKLMEGGGEGEESSKSKRGGAGKPFKKKGGAKGEQIVTIERSQRQKRKFVTSVVGLDTFGLKLKDAAKKLGKKFACGASVNKLPNGQQSIDIQGDYSYELPDVLLELFSEVDKSAIMFLEKGKKTAAFSN